MTKCVGATISMNGGNPNFYPSKTEELMDFLRMNDRILRFKKRTARNIEDLTNNQR
jgi:hypothetical protein